MNSRRGLVHLLESMRYALKYPDGIYVQGIAHDPYQQRIKQ
jgi:hypothetical protein